MPTSKSPTPPADSGSEQGQAAIDNATVSPPPAAGEGQESSQGGVTVSTGFPHSSLSGEGFPTITAEGTQLSDEELKAAQKTAKEMNVTLNVEGGGQNG